MSPSYAIAVTLGVTHDHALALTRERLAEEGFAILNETDIAAILRTRIGEEVGPYVIFGVCSAPLAFRALQADPNAGVLLPCTVAVHTDAAGHTVVAALNPVAALGLAANTALEPLGAEAADRLQRVLDHLGERHAAPVAAPAAVVNAEEIC